MHHFLPGPLELTDWLATWGYLGVFVCVFLGNLGVPLPEETILIGAGFMAARQVLEPKRLLAVAIISAVAGDSFGFLLGRTGGQRLLERLSGRFAFVHQRYFHLRAFFDRHGSKAVFMARFITGLRFMVGPMAGAAGMRFTRFLGWNVLGAIGWCSLAVGVGYLLGDELWPLIGKVHSGVFWTGLAVLLLGVALVVGRWRLRPQPHVNE